MSMKDLIERMKADQNAQEQRVQACRDRLSAALIAEFETAMERSRQHFQQELPPLVEAIRRSRVVDFFTEIIHEYDLQAYRRNTFVGGSERPLLAIIAFDIRSADTAGYYLDLHIHPQPLSYTIESGYIYEREIAEIRELAAKLDLKPHLDALETLQVKQFPTLQHLSERYGSLKMNPVQTAIITLCWNRYSVHPDNSGGGYTDTMPNEIYVNIEKTANGWKAIVSHSAPYDPRLQYQSHERVYFPDIPEKEWTSGALQTALARAFVALNNPPKV